MVGGSESRELLPLSIYSTNQLLPTPSTSFHGQNSFPAMSVNHHNLLQIIQSQSNSPFNNAAMPPFVPQPSLPLPFNANPAFMGFMLNSLTATQPLFHPTVVPEQLEQSQQSVECAPEAPETSTNVDIDPDEGHMHSPGLPTQPYFPSHFLRGTHIQVDRKNTKLVEDLNKDDFYGVQSIASAVHDLNMLTGIVKAIDNIPQDPLQVMITFEVEEVKEDGSAVISVCDLKVPIEYPLYELEKGWCSYHPSKAVNLYGIPAKQLKIGDKCIVLTSFDDYSNPT
ncbi:unnamed protein product [Bursaphelenchus okinawaensis]|uniref:AXH domain-containing protein n=1 Tax=Bursaphelenchus okinawaensis TaxID=465554 RepID=A0A811LCI9_9BILA|nr:unnamed protein product [Bursaphelenchus okinawaensis]CAG9120194.1 unnamed protein product [Bursaphelenchus okinawaensis]